MAYLRRHRFRSLLAVGVVLLLIFLVGNLSKIEVHRSISEGMVGTYTDRDLPPVVTSLLSRGLVKFDASSSAVADLADHWELNKEANEYTFTLSRSLKWLDGSPLKSSDLVFSIPNVVQSNIDDWTIKFKLTDSFSPFPSLLTKPVFKTGTMLGVGPYKVGRVDLTSIFVKKIQLISTDKSLPDVVIHFYPNEKTADYALKSGEVQSLLGVSDANDFLSQPAYKLYSQTNYDRIVTIFYNTKDAILSDDNFRLALSFAAPSISGQQEAITSLPMTSWAFNPDVKDYLDHPAMAKQYLAKVKHGLDSTVTLTATSSLKDVGERVVDEWNKQGIKAILRVESGVPQNFQALLIAQNIPVDPDQYSLWHGTQTQTNISKISLARVDKDLEDGRKTADLEQRKALYKDFQKVLLDHAPATFLYFPKNNVVYLKKIETDLKKILDIQLNYL